MYDIRVIHTPTLVSGIKNGLSVRLLGGVQPTRLDRVTWIRK